jgi:hypothetical protein
MFLKLLKRKVFYKYNHKSLSMYGYNCTICTVGVGILILSFTLKYLHFKKCYAMKIMGRDFEKNVDFVAFLFINFHRKIVLVAPQSEVSTDICTKKIL